ncbi:MAG: 3'-5' exonuclease [Deltaproteobacteria bacterium]
MYLVVDFEATCDDAGAVPRDEMEIIEVGACLVRDDLVTPVAEFQSFVRPVRHPQLTPFCTRLTTIRQSEVSTAPSFPEVAERWHDWVTQNAEQPIFCSWGDYDRRQLQQDVAFHDVANPLPFGHINLKRKFSEAQSLRKKLGMAQALRHVGLPLGGTHHRAIDDARNIAALLPFIFSRGPNS